ncbi:helix-turn-helix transcriptional regulator [Actinoplanes teichomyceticus]|uniref:AAA ATPase-like protein n=1 Tax=Actinoplanes teichomyceticus TaxID=1867 RepID=Q6ZZH7_ACTTI|nr:LuxR family transcriptional regulator [Actinoplanes teichomyceticus]TWG09462.1 AAA ATPase-like protein [Actinoplanes teichomyceticus]CAG15028.1 LuxR regulatory protein [Actinoplanes teichomyceticus]
MTLRKHQLELLLFDEVHRASARGEGAVLLVSGAVGTGKTALLQAMAARAGRRGGWSFVVTGSARERGHPFGVLDRLIRSMCAAGMAEPFPGGMDCGENFFVMMDRVGAAIREFAGDRPVLVGIDDVHFVDEQSLRAVSYLIRRIESSGVVLVLNESTSYERDMAGLRAEMLHLPFCYRIRLTPLTSTEVAERLSERFGGVPDRASVQFGVQVSGGIPLILQALIDDLADSGPGVCEPGANFRQAVLRSLHRCAPSTTAVAQAIAVLGDYAAPELVAELGGVDAALIEESIRDLREMGLLEHDWFRHPHTRAAVLAGIPVPQLPEMHRRAAELLHQSGAPAGAVAEHLIAAQDGGRAPWRVVILSEAAREALAAGDVDSAVLSLRHAVAASSDETQRAHAGVLLAEAQWHTDPSRAARRLGELSQDARAGRFTGPDTLIAVNQLLWWGEFAEADELLRLAGDEECGDSSLAHLWAIFSRAAGGTEICDEHTPSGGSPLARSGPMAVVTYLSSAASLASESVAADRTEMLLGIRAGAPLTPALYALVVLVQSGRLEEAITWCGRLLKEEWIHRTPMRRVMIQTIESVAMLRAGDSAGALRGIREVFDAVPPPAWGVVAGLPLSVAVRASTELGDTHAARSYLAVPVPPAMFDTPFALPYLLALGWYHLAMGHPESSLRHTRSCLDLTARWGVDAGRITAGPAGLDVSRPSPPPAADRVDAGHRTPAAVREPAPDQREATPVPPHAGPDPAEPAAAHRGAEDGARLTDAEQRVAALAAAGNTNRQIAERLFITVSTVEQHLTKIYRKLNLRSRSGLRRYSH